MLTLKKVKELVEAPSHAKRTPSPKMLFEEGIVLLRREFDQGSHLTVYNSGYVLFSAGKRNTVFHIHDCCGDYAYDAAEGKGDVIKEEYFENCEWHIRALFEGERKMEDNQAKCEDAGRSNVCVSYHALSEDWSEIADRTINMLEKIMEYPYFKGLEADRYSFYRVPKALVKADLFQKMSGDAKLLYAVLLDRMSLSIKNGWQDKHGNAYIICTIEEVMDSIHCARQKAVKLLNELEQEFRLIERRRQGLGKPNLLYVKDLYAGLSQSNYWKYENHTSGSLKNELPGVPKSNGSNTEKINKTDNSETDLIYPAELQEEEQYRRYFKEALELEILEQGYPADKAILYEILELLVETVTSRKKFLRICGEEKPKEVVKSRLMKLDSSHIQYILECLKENSTQIRNIKQYLLATLYNAPVTVDSYYSAQVRHEFGWGGRVDKN